MVGWNHHFNGHESEQTPGDSEGQEVWYAAVHGVTKSQTQRSDRTTIWLHWVLVVAFASLFVACRI